MIGLSDSLLAVLEDASGPMKPYSKKWFSIIIKFLNSLSIDSLFAVYPVVFGVDPA